MPLYERGLVSSRIREAKERANQSRIEIEETRRDARQEAIDSWEALQSSTSRIESFNIEVEATRIALEGTREESRVGARTILDILDAEQEYLDARVNLVGAERDQIVATYLVLRAMGLLSAGNLAVDAPLYNPRQDYDSVKDSWYGFGDVPYISDW